MKKRIFVLLVIGLICMPAVAGPILDLTAEGSSGYIGLGYFEQYSPQPTGTGYIDSFVRVSTNQEVVQGYNTSARPLEFDENSSPQFTRALLLSSIPVVNIYGTNYRQFLLDINQTGTNPYLSLDGLEIYLGSAGNLTSYAISPSNLGNLIYDLDAGGDNWVHLDYNLNSGSGSGDMLFSLPDSLFVVGKYVYLYSRFGENFPNNGGYEEWAVRTGEFVIPAPDALVLGSIGVVFVSILRMKQTL